MMTTPIAGDEVRISASANRRVRHESGELLEPKSAVTWSPYWQRRADDRDIVVHAAEAANEKKDS